MSSHWETSARPLFVKTVFVNGDRHAILFEKDPLLRCGKKISRPNSSLSSASDLSITFSESQDSSSEGKDPKLKNIGQGKDLSSELQSCLVKLKLASGNLEIQKESSAEECLCSAREPKRNQNKEKGSSKQKRHKWNREKVCRRKQRQNGEPREGKQGGRKNSPENSCYVYNLENVRGKKKYCFVKISSQPPQFILNCCCDENWNENHNCSPPNKNNFVISATIHNLVMTSERNESILHKTIDYIFPFQETELHWNHYLTKSYYNSLSDRVFQWLDLAKKRKTQREKLNLTEEDEPLNNNNTERIFSGKTFLGEKTEFSWKQGNRILMNKKTEKIPQNETNEDVDGEVVGEPHVETLLSAETLNSQDCQENNSPRNGAAGTPGISEQQKTQIKDNFSVKTNQNATVSPVACAKYVNLPIPNATVPPLKIQDFLLNLERNKQNKRKAKEPRNCSPHQNKKKETDPEEKDFLTTAVNTWEKSLSNEDVLRDQFDTDKRCQVNRNPNVDKIKNPILTENFAEKNQKSINNLNITRTRPVLIQNLLSPQQPDKVGFLEEEKFVWASEKNTGKPQLHIFMPSVLLKDQSDDSMSEAESFLNL